MMLEQTEIRELDCRRAHGIEVRLLWEPGSERALVAVDDERTGGRFQIRVAAADALDAFHHPYAYEQRDADPVAADLS